MSQPMSHHGPGEQRPRQGYQQGDCVPPPAHPQYGQPHYPPQPGNPQPDPGQTWATPPMAYPSQPYFPQRPVPPARSHIGLIIGLLGGALALALVCGGMGFFVIRSITNNPAATKAAPARTAGAFTQKPPPAPQTYGNTMEVGGFRLQVAITPARTGTNSVHLYAFTPGGQPQKVEEWKVTASLPAAGIDRVNVPVLQITDNHAVGQISLPAPGQWQFQFTLRTAQIKQDSVNAEVPIR